MSRRVASVSWESCDPSGVRPNPRTTTVPTTTAGRMLTFERASSEIVII